MFVLTQITNIEILAFIAVVVFKDTHMERLVFH